MIRRGRVKTVLSVLVGLWVTVLGLDGQADQGSIDSPGLVGGHFGSDDFSRLQSFSRVAGLSHEWTEADDYGQQWSAKWQGMIKGPALGAVIFRADTDQSVVLAIGVGAETVIDSGEGKVEERLSMQKGAWYPIMQLSTTDDYARSTRRGGNLDLIDKPLTMAPSVRHRLEAILEMGSEDERLSAINKLTSGYVEMQREFE